MTSRNSELKPKDISRDFYKKFKNYRNFLVQHVQNDIENDKKFLLVQKLFDRIFFIYFICEKGLITVRGKPLLGKTLFSTGVLNNGRLTENFQALILLVNAPDPQQMVIQGQEIKCCSIKGGLFRLEDEVKLKISASKKDWEEIFNFLNEYDWQIEGNDHSHDLITPNILGHVYERSVVEWEKKGFEKVVEEALSEKSERKGKGVFYTPENITEYICQRTIHDFKDIKILDPACGSGAFLVKAAEILFAMKSKLDSSRSPLDIKVEILHNNLHGVDILEGAIEIAKRRLWLWMISSVEPNTEIIELPDLDQKIMVGNALIGWVDENIECDTDETYLEITKKFANSINENVEEVLRHRPFHWRFYFPEIMKSGGFDIIIGNPPYVFTRGMNFDAFERQFFKKKYLKDYEPLTRGKAVQSGKLNSFSLFIIRGLNLLKKDGLLGFIVQNTILRTTTNDIVRQFLVKETSIEEITDLAGGVFTGVTASTIIMILKRNSPESGEHTMINYDVTDLVSQEYKTHMIDQQSFLDNVICAFNIHVDGNIRKKFKQMVENTFSLGEITREIIEGLVTRKSDKLFIDDASHPLARKLLRGKNVDRYVINWPEGQYIIYDPAKLHRARPKWVHESPLKLITQRIGGGIYPLRIAFDDEQHYIFASTNAIIFKNPPTFEFTNYDPKYVLALLNSKLMNAYFLLNFSNRSSYTVNIGKTFLEHLPIRIISKERQRDFETIADYLLFLNKNYKEQEKLITFLDEKILDSMVFELYYNFDLKNSISVTVSPYLQPINRLNSDMETFEMIKRNCMDLLSSVNVKNAILTIQNQKIVNIINELFQQRSNNK